MRQMTNNTARDQTYNLPLVYIVIPNKNGKDHLSYSLQSLFRTSYPNYRVVLVDDGSTDGSLMYVAREFRDVTIIRNSGKIGFAGAVNTGIRHALNAGAAYIAVSNSDVKVLPEWLDLVLPQFADSPNAGLVGFTEITREREELFYAFSTAGATVVSRSVQRLAGCLYLCSAAVFGEIGLFDEDYFMYGEDNDLFFRLLSAGFTIVETNVPVWHYGEGSSRNAKFLVTWLAYRNALRFSFKNETVFRVFRMLFALANQGCNPFLTPGADVPNFRRLRRYNPIVNIFILLASCAWNLCHLRSTLKSRSQLL